MTAPSTAAVFCPTASNRLTWEPSQPGGAPVTSNVMW